MATPNPFDEILFGQQPRDDELVDPDLEGYDPDLEVASQPTPGPELEPEPVAAANPFDDILFGAPEPEPEPEYIPEEMGTFANLWAGLKSRGTGLVGDFAGGAQTIGQQLESAAGAMDWVPQLGGFVNRPGAEWYDWDYLNAQEWQEYSERGGDMLLRDIQEDLQAIDYGFTSNAHENWELMKSSPQLLEKAQALGAFALETGVISLADMAGAVVVPPAYIIARTEEMGQERAASQGRPGAPTPEDMSVSFVGALAITAMERFGFENIAAAFIKGGSAPQKIFRAAAGEGGTEFVQEQIEYGVETAGTEAGKQLTAEEYWEKSLERGLMGTAGGAPAGAVLATPGAMFGPKEDPSEPPIVSPRVKELGENERVVRDELDRAESKAYVQQWRAEAQAFEDERVERETMELARRVEEIDAQEEVFKTAAHAEKRRRDLEKKYGETGLETAQNPATGEWVLAHRGRASLYSGIAERAERFDVGLRPTEAPIEVEEQLEVATEPAPTTEGIEVAEEVEDITLQEPEGIEVEPMAAEQIDIPATVETGLEPVTQPIDWEPQLRTDAEAEIEQQVFANGAEAKRAADALREQFPDSNVEAIQTTAGEWKVLKRGKASIERVKKERAAKEVDLRPTEAEIEVEEGEDIDITEPAPEVEGIEVAEAEEIDVGEAIPQIGVEEITEGEEVIEAPRKIYPGRKPPDDDEGGPPPPPAGAAPTGEGPIMPSITSGAIKKGRKPRKGVKSDIEDTRNQLAAFPTDITDLSVEETERLEGLRTQLRDLMDEQDYGITPEEAKQGRIELKEKAMEAKVSVGRFDTLKDIQRKLGQKKVAKVRDATYDRVKNVIVEAENKGETPTIQLIQQMLGVNAQVAQRNLDRYNKEVAEPVEAAPLEAPDELTQEAAEAAAEVVEEGREAVDEQAQIAAYNFVEGNPAFVGLKLSHKPGDERFGKTLAHYYGDIDATEGFDGDPVDVILNKDFELGKEYSAFVADIVNEETGDFEQHKVLTGFDDILDAEEALETMYPGQMENITLLNPDEFPAWVKSNRTQEPFDREQFRADMNKGMDLAKPTPTDTVLDPEELGTTEEDAIDRSPWLLADGAIVTTGGDHMEYAMERGMKADNEQDVRAISQMQLEGKGIRSAFFFDEVENRAIAWLHVHDDQLLTEAQINTVETFAKAARKAGRNPVIMIGSTPTAKKGEAPENPIPKKVSIAALKRDWSERKAGYRADMKKFYEGLADKSAKYAAAAVGRLRGQLKPDPRNDDLITFIRKHGGINVNLAGDFRGRLSHLNKDNRLPGLPGIEQTDGTGLSLDQAAEIATESNYIREGRTGSYDQDMLIDALMNAESGVQLYSDQNEEWVKQGWEEEQERAEAEYQAKLETEKDWTLDNLEDFPAVDNEMAELMAEAALLDEGATEAIASRDVSDDVVKQELRTLIDERKNPKTPEPPVREPTEEVAEPDERVEAEAPAREGAEPVREGRREPAEKPDPGDYSDVTDYPWQELAEAADVEILEPPSPDLEGPRTFIIDVYSDLERTKFVRQVYAANFFRYRDVRQAYMTRFGPVMPRVQDQSEWIEVSKVSFETDEGHDTLARHIIDGKRLNKPYRKLEPISRIKDERAAERKKEREARNKGWLTPEQWSSTVARYNDELMAEPDPADVVVHWGEEFKKGKTPRDYISHAEGKARVEEWKARAKEIGDLSRHETSGRNNSQRVILSLFDDSGAWAQPWIDAGYDVRAIDLKRDDVDIMDIDYGWLLDMGFLEGPGIWGILAACPCTHFTGTAAQDRLPVTKTGKLPRWINEGGTDFIGKTHDSVDLVNQTLSIIDFLKPKFWALENPVGRVKDITGVPSPRLSFNPNNYGFPAGTKKTQIYGNFNADLPTANVDPRKENGGIGSFVQETLGSKDERDGGLRSITPEGFAYAFFMANNDFDNPVADEVARKDFVRTIPAEVKEKDPTIERKVELVAKLALLDGTYPTMEDQQDGTSAGYDDRYRLEDTDNWPKWAQELISDIQDALQEDWRIEEGNTATVRELNHLDQEVRMLLGVGQKREVAFPQREMADYQPVDSINDLSRYADDNFDPIDPVLTEAAVDAINVALADLAEAGYTFDQLSSEPAMSLPDYLRDPMKVILDVGSGAIPVAKGIRAVQKGDKRTKPENVLDRLFNYKNAIENALGEEVISTAEFKDFVREEYPFLANALDETIEEDPDPGQAMRRQRPEISQQPGYDEMKSDMYERLGRDDLAWGPAPQPLMPAEVGPPPPVPERSEAELTESWEPVPERERPPEVDVDVVLNASAEGPADTPSLTDIPLTAEVGDRTVTHNAKWFKDAIDKRLVNLNKIRGCA